MREKLRKEALAAARQQLDSYLEMNSHRKTSERYAILDAVYGINVHFTLDELGAYLEAERNFPVSKPTLYNTLKLFVQLRLVVRHNIQGKTRYEPCYASGNHVHQICTSCGKVTEIPSAHIADEVANLKLKRFRPDGYAVYIYGICSRCQAKLTRQKRIKEKQNIKEIKK